MKIDKKNAWLCIKLGLFVLVSFFLTVSVKADSIVVFESNSDGGSRAYFGENKTSYELFQSFNFSGGFSSVSFAFTLNGDFGQQVGDYVYVEIQECTDDLPNGNVISSGVISASSLYGHANEYIEIPLDESISGVLDNMCIVLGAIGSTSLDYPRVASGYESTSGFIGYKRGKLSLTGVPTVYAGQVLDFKLLSGVTLPELPTCTASDISNTFSCDSEEWQRGIEWEYFEDTISHPNLAPDTKFYSHAVVRIKFNDSDTWSDYFTFTPDIPPCEKDTINTRQIYCEDYTDVYTSPNLGLDWLAINEGETYSPNSYIWVSYLETRDDENMVVKIKFDEDSENVTDFVEVNMDALRCDPSEDSYTCDFANYLADIIEGFLNSVLSVISGSFDLFFPFDFNLSQNVEYCADFWDIPHPSTLEIPSFISGAVVTGSGEINIDNWFDSQFCTIGENGGVDFNDEFGGGDLAVYFLMMIGYYGLFFRSKSKREYGDIQEKIILPKINV